MRNPMRHERVIREKRKRIILVKGFYDHEEVRIVGVWAAQNDRSISKELVHECGVLSPPWLLTAGFASDPSGAG